MKARKQALGVLSGFPFLKHRAESRALAVASSPLPQESSDTSSSRAGGSRNGLWNRWVAQAGQMGQTPIPKPTIIWHKGLCWSWEMLGPSSQKPVQSQHQLLLGMNVAQNSPFLFLTERTLFLLKNDLILSLPSRIAMAGFFLFFFKPVPFVFPLTKSQRMAFI